MKKNKWAEPETPVGHYGANHYSLYNECSNRIGHKEVEIIYEEIIPNLFKFDEKH